MTDHNILALALPLALKGGKYKTNVNAKIK
jgi:hypothetical protein